MRFDLGHDLDLKFSRSNMKFAISQPKMVRLPRNEKQTYQLNSRHEMQALGLILAITFNLRESDVSKPGIFQGWVHISYMWTYWWNVKFDFRNSWVAMVNYRNLCLRFWLYIIYNIIQSPRFTGGDLMFLYRFVCPRRCRPHTFVHSITSEQLFRFLSFLVGLMTLTCRLPD